MVKQYGEQKIKIARGLKENMPNLDEGELGLAKDTHELYVGGENGNIPVMNIKNHIVFSDENDEHIGVGSRADKFSDGRLCYVYRAGYEHGRAESELRMRISKDKYGLEWEEYKVITDEEGYDIKNICMGVTSDDTIIFAAGVGEVDGEWVNPRIYKSSDEGETWSYITYDTEVISAHGRLVEMNNGKMFLTFGSAGDKKIEIVESNDKFDTVTRTKIYNENDLPSSDDVPTEPVLIKINEDLLFGVTRNRNNSNELIQFYSTDGGDTWSELTYCKNVSGVNQPTELMKHNDKVIFVWPGRNKTHPEYQESIFNCSGVFNYTTKHIDDLTSTDKEWRKPVLSNIHVPDHGSTRGGDSGYQTLYEVNQDLFLIYYSGNYNEGGTDIVLSKLDLEVS